MKTLLASAGAAALMLSAAACDNNRAAAPGSPGVETRAQMDPVYDDELSPQGEVARTAETDTLDSDLREQYVLASNELEASNLIGASVIGNGGEEIATVADIWLGENGDTPQLLVRDGGFTGLGGDLRVVSFDAASISPRRDGAEPDVSITLAEASLEALPEFEQDDMNDYRLASEMIGSNPTLSFSGETVRIADLIITASGEPRYAIVSPSLISTDLFVVDMDAVTVAQGDGDENEVVIDIEADAFNTARAYREM